MIKRTLILLCIVIFSASFLRGIVQFPPKTVTKYVKIPYEKVKIVENYVPTTHPDGYITEKQCENLAFGEDFRDVIWQYGWPAADNGEDSYAGYLYYPLREDHNRGCQLDFGGRQEVRNKILELASGVDSEMSYDD